MSLSPKIKVRLKAIALLSVFCFSFLFNTAPARAQGFPTYDNTQNLWNTMNATLDEIEKNTEKVKTNVVDSLMVGTMKAFEFVLNKIAYDLAVTMASGNWGQSPLFHTKSMGDYWAGVAGDALGTALDSFGRGIGFNLCTLPDVKLDLALKMGLNLAYSEPKPSCSWQQLKDTYSVEGITSKYWGKNGENFSKMFNASLELSDTDVGIGIAAKSKIDAYALNAEAAAKAQREEGKGAKPLSSIISGGILTPADVNADMLRKASKANQADKNADRSAADIRAGMQAGSVQVLINAASTFINAFAGTAMDNFLTKGMFPFGLGKVKCVPSYLKIGGLAIDTCVETKYDVTGNLYGGTESSWKQEAVALFAEELLVTKARQDDKYNLLAKFSMCPDNPGPENCVLDTNFAQAIKFAELGKPLTIQQAITESLLDKTWPLISPLGETAGIHNDKECYANNFCYKNLKVLRKARVLPLGFEIAALVPIELNNNVPWTLQDVLDGYYITSSPFYHLVNPNWVLKIPPARCKSIVYGDQLLNPNSFLRQEVCADLQGCVEYDKTGKCIAYGYCLKEKNTWRFEADYCDEQYATCKTLTNSAGKTSSFLTRTLNSEMCDSENVGCRFYSSYKIYPGNIFASGTWDHGYKSNTQNNYGYYLNDKTESCVAANAGCTAFTTNTQNTADLFYFKKAPDYLNCYDSNSLQAGVQWPQNLSDFNKIKPINKDECGKYAAVCLPEEDGCNRYTRLPLDMFKSGIEEVIVGKFTPATSTDSGTIFNDQCPEVCVGYGAYKELKTKYSNGNDLVYIIPKKDAVCESKYDGCSAFVNLSVTAGGNIQTEYFSNLRLCMTPDQNRQKNFYTYEGRDGGGYQLISYTFLKNGEEPAQYFRNADELTEMGGLCAPGKIDEDCRAFRDDQGRIYYAYLSKTVVVSDKCTPYRAVKSEFYNGTINCLGSYDGLKGTVSTDRVVFYDEASGYCIYNGLPKGISASEQSSADCPQSSLSCRKYQGNIGNYVENILTQNFKTPVSFTNDDSTSGWGKRNGSGDTLTDIVVSDESLIQGEKSLKVSAKANSGGFKHFNTRVVPGGSYSISFLAKGNGTWNIYLWHNVDTTVGQITLTDNWKRYEFFVSDILGVTEAKPLDEGAHFTFIPSATQAFDKTFYLDNVVIDGVQDIVYLIKDKLSVPTSCDEVQTDNLPGPYLGCRAYKTPVSKDPIYLHNFDYLCRDGAEGCTKVYDTNNRMVSGTSDYIIHNIWLSKSRLSKAQDSSGNMTTSVSGVELGCFVSKEDLGCYVEKVTALPGAVSSLSEYFTYATIIFPPKDTSPSYLVLNKNSSCSAAASGCTALGSSVLLSDGSRKYQDVFLRLVPETDNFEKSICNDLAEGCDIWRSGPATQYFKDPEIYGNRLCERKKQEDGSLKWVYKGTTTTCITGEFLPSYGATGYAQQVGLCPADQAECTMFIDRYADSSSKRCTVSGKKCMFDKECTSDPSDVCTDPSKEYYLLNNDKIKTAQKDCNNNVSLAGGCILLDQSNNPTKNWNTAVSYALSESNEGRMVPASSTSANDANIILKVRLDRECSKWAYCSSYLLDTDSDGLNPTSHCYTLGICDKAQAGSQTEGQCSHVVTATEDSHRVLTKNIYQNRDTSWNAEEYTGYSMLNSYQIYDLQVSEDNTELVYVTTTAGVRKEYKAKPYSEYDLEAKDTSKSVETVLSCRGYPEQGSPFDIWVLNNPGEKIIAERSFKTGYSNKVNLCTMESGESCDCNYVKYDYGGKTVYLGYTNKDKKLSDKNGGYEKGICLSGQDKDNNNSLEGQSCDYTECADTAKDCEVCGVGGKCAPLKSKTSLLGWQGFCLEKDSRFNVYKSNNVVDNSCLTWWPVERVRGTVDLNITDNKAGYDIDKQNTDRFVCVYNNPVGTRTSSFVSSNNLTFIYDPAANKIANSQELKVKVDDTIKSFYWFARDRGSEAFGNNQNDKLNSQGEKICDGYTDNSDILKKNTENYYIRVATEKVKSVEDYIDAASKNAECYIDDLTNGSTMLSDAAALGYFYCHSGINSVDKSGPLEKGYTKYSDCRILKKDSEENCWYLASPEKEIYCKKSSDFETFNKFIAGHFGGEDGKHFFFPNALFLNPNDKTNPDCGEDNNGQRVQWTHESWKSTPGPYIFPSKIQSFNDFYNNFYSFRGYKDGGDKNDVLTYIKNVTIKGLPDNSEAYVWQGNETVIYDFLTGRDKTMESPGTMYTRDSREFLIYPYNLNNFNPRTDIVKSHIVKIDVLVSAALYDRWEPGAHLGTYDYKNNFEKVDLNKITFYNLKVLGESPPGAICEENIGNDDVCIEIAKKAANTRGFSFTTSTNTTTPPLFTVWGAIVSHQGTGYFTGNGFLYNYIWNPSGNTNKNSLEAGDGNSSGYGVQVIFDKSDKFKGVAIDLEDKEDGGQAISAVVIVHYTDGKCGFDVQVASEEEKMKPVTWRMKENRDVFYSFVNETDWKRVVIDNVLKGWEYFKTNILAKIRHFFGSLSYYQSDKTIVGKDLKTYNLFNYSASAGNTALFNRDFASVLVTSTALSMEQVTSSDGSYVFENKAPLKSLLSKMYAKVIDTTGVYLSGASESSPKTFDATTPQNAAKAGITIHPPIIAAPITMNSTTCQAQKGGTNCDSFVLNAFSLTSNNIPEGDVTIAPNYPLIVRFYAWADPAQMPLTRIMIQDGVSSRSDIVLQTQSAANRKLKCTAKGFCGGSYIRGKYDFQIPCDVDNDCKFYDAKYRDGSGNLRLISGTCILTSRSTNVNWDQDWTADPNFFYYDNPQGFGNTTDTGCRQGYYNFHLSGYTESGMEVFPKVQVLDNWGWCSGECTKPIYSDNGISYGCYKDGEEENCDFSENNINPWIEYSGNVRVK